MSRAAAAPTPKAPVIGSRVCLRDTAYTGDRDIDHMPLSVTDTEDQGKHGTILICETPEFRKTTFGARGTLIVELRKKRVAVYANQTIPMPAPSATTPEVPA